jgi:hypothetical protein
MRHFYVPDEESAKRCHYSRDHKTPITVSGIDIIDNKPKLYPRVVVQSVEDYGASARRGRRWRVTIFNSN